MVVDVQVFVSRVIRLPLVDRDGATLARVEDLVLSPAHSGRAPRLLGVVANVQRRRIFVGSGRIKNIEVGGVRLRGAAVDLGHFERRPGELLVVADLLDHMVETRTVMDIALTSSDQPGLWEVAAVALGSRGPLRRRTIEVVDWRQVAKLFDTGPMAAQVAALREMNATDLASAFKALPVDRRRLLAEAMDDEELADVLEELAEDDQLRLLAEMDIDRVADVVEEMQPDDAADLLAEMDGEQRLRLLEAMDPEEAAPIRRLLRYGATTAGGLMTPEPLILPPQASVAEALARIRQPDLHPAVAAQVFVCEPPLQTPTGRLVGVVGIQRLLREPPSSTLAGCADEAGFVRPDLSELRVAEMLAAYNLIAVAVCDETGRLLGAVTVDDVLDRTLPAGWRQRRR
jgi:CBS domain-containing protein